MSDSKTSHYSSGIGLPGLLTVAFVVLKLCGVISWSWWWVLSPIWIPFGICVGILIVALLVMAIVAVFSR